MVGIDVKIIIARSLTVITIVSYAVIYFFQHDYMHFNLEKMATDVAVIALNWLNQKHHNILYDIRSASTQRRVPFIYITYSYYFVTLILSNLKSHLDRPLHQHLLPPFERRLGNVVGDGIQHKMVVGRPS